MRSARHGRGAGLGKNQAWYIPDGSDRFDDDTNTTIIIDEDHVLYKVYDRWLKAEEVLSSLGWAFIYTFPDWISRLLAGQAEKASAWNYLHDVEDSLGKFPQVLRMLTPEELQKAQDRGVTFEESHTWNTEFSFPECLVVNNEALPMVRPARLETPIICASRHPDAHFPGLATYTQQQLEHLFWSLRCTCPVDTVHDPWTHDTVAHVGPVSDLDAYHPDRMVYNIATGPAFAFSPWLFGCSSKEHACNLLASTLLTWGLSNVGDDAASPRGVSRDAIRSGQRVEQTLRFEKPSFGELMMRIASFGEEDTYQKISALQWKIMEKKVAEKAISYRRPKIKDPRNFDATPDRDPVLKEYRRLENGDARYKPKPVSAPAGPPPPPNQ